MRETAILIIALKKKTWVALEGFSVSRRAEVAVFLVATVEAGVLTC